MVGIARLLGPPHGVSILSESSHTGSLRRGRMFFHPRLLSLLPERGLQEVPGRRLSRPRRRPFIQLVLALLDTPIRTFLCVLERVAS